MRKLSALVAFIIQELDFVAAENVESFHVYENFKPVAYPVNGREDVICLYDQEYSAIVRIERFPVTCPPERVFGLLACWLLANDPHPYRYKIERNNGVLVPLANPDINTELESDSTLAIELIIPFREPVFAILDDTGIYHWNNKKYRLADSNNPAEQFEQRYIISANYDNPNWRRGSTG